MLKYVDVLNNIRKYRIGKLECFIYIYFLKYVFKIKMVDLFLYCILIILNKNLMCIGMVLNILFSKIVFLKWVD